LFEANSLCAKRALELFINVLISKSAALEFPSLSTPAAVTLSPAFVMMGLLLLQLVLFFFVYLFIYLFIYFCLYGACSGALSRGPVRLAPSFVSRLAPSS
jgi:hypothetical protein